MPTSKLIIIITYFLLLVFHQKLIWKKWSLEIFQKAFCFQKESLCEETERTLIICGCYICKSPETLKCVCNAHISP